MYTNKTENLTTWKPKKINMYLLMKKNCLNDLDPLNHWLCTTKYKLHFRNLFFFEMSMLVCFFGSIATTFQRFSLVVPWYKMVWIFHSTAKTFTLRNLIAILKCRTIQFFPFAMRFKWGVWVWCVCSLLIVWSLFRLQSKIM